MSTDWAEWKSLIKDYSKAYVQSVVILAVLALPKWLQKRLK